MILVISTKRTKNESTLQRIAPSKKRTRLRKIKDMNMARKLEIVKAMYQRKKQKTIYFRRQHDQKSKWVWPHQKS